MATTYTYAVNGEILGEHTLGQSRLDYLTDAIGSVVATVDQTLAVKSTARYKPYGADLATTGTRPIYGWVGKFGSRRTNRPYPEIYNRARHLGDLEGTWTTIDPTWPAETSYVYATANPTTYSDSSGMEPVSVKHQKKRAHTSPWDSAPCLAAKTAAAAALSSCFSKSDAKILSAIMQCIAYGESDCKPGNSDGPYGLYQLNCTQYNNCAPKGCKQCGDDGPTKSCGIYDRDCNTQATVSLIVAMLDHQGTFTGTNLGDVLCMAFGVIYPCQHSTNSNHNGPQHGNTKTMDCLRAKGIDVFKFPRPVRLPGCAKCPKDPFGGTP